jgi:hypothetical protein
VRLDGAEIVIDGSPSTLADPWALVRDAGRHRAEIRAMLGRPPCHACKGRAWWVATAGGVFCQRCHPAVLGRLVAMRFETAQEGDDGPYARGEP